MATREQIAAAHAKYAEEGLPTFEVKHGAFCFNCYIIPQARCLELPNFAQQMVADNLNRDELHYSDSNNQTLFGVSDAVPKQFRRFVVQHEMFEFVDKCICTEAAMRELDLAESSFGREEMMEDYLAMRLKLFEPLVPYTAQHPVHYPYLKRCEFNLTREYYGLKMEILREQKQKA